ncbi:4-hydroxybenzoyl-CoA thioesterase [Streptomyces daqingensis]|uniref:4-hydroxybenzoyl-CoA thioesterase n=1 Tax=Streptomyces daqingensis TaxID=1472640 RepID=A0ABQ2MTD8_9ACTN|nr:thioesterase family protein [Streptomyces daqingensis]GGO57464.1 4-hydroxybenzoyl-CoA thioesterase [Streptomyces daqingensis]
MSGGRAGLPDHRAVVVPEWIDYNGHMSEAFYVLVFGHATDAMMPEVGLDEAYRERSGCSLYTAEAHVRYLREVPEGAELTVRTRVLGVDAKKCRLAHEMYAAGPAGRGGPADGSAAPVATTELLMIHVDQGAGRAAPFPEPVRERLASLVEAAPEWAGRSIGPVPRS